MRQRGAERLFILGFHAPNNPHLQEQCGLDRQKNELQHGPSSADLVILNPEMVFNRKERKEHKESRIQGGEGASFAHQQGEQEKA